MYRGVDFLIPREGMHQYIRGDRKPRDTGNLLGFNIAFNLMIEMQYGIVCIRRRSLFVTGDIAVAKNFAKEKSIDFVACIKPIKNFRFIWSPIVADSKLISNEMNEAYFEIFHSWELEKFPQLKSNIDLNWTEIKNISIALDSSKSKGFRWTGRTLLDRLQSRIRMLAGTRKMHGYGYLDSDLPQALESGHEVMLTECPGGYWIYPFIHNV